MLLRQATYSLNLGTKEQPIHIDDVEEWNPESSQPPTSSVASTSLSLPQRPLTTHIPLNSQVKPRTTPREKGTTIVSSFATSSMRKDSLVAEPMTAHSQEDGKLLKRKRGDPEEEADPELAKKFRKSEKKRRNKKRRAARVAQLGTNISALHSFPLHLNIDLARGARSLQLLERRLLVQDVPLPTHMPQSGHSAPESLPIMSPRGPRRRQDKQETILGHEAIGLNQQHARPPSDPQMVLIPSVPIISLPDPPSSRIDEDALVNSPPGNPLRRPQARLFSIVKSRNEWHC
ncbi:hypothetical protein JB92DRAFT_1845309 [Gautieria morchelliformis]|nr:hypothetical protein JB92DRAFT_1845309 [Gautieria morchelliformis]